ncbi:MULTISPECIES: hypothetical protein [unclassified Algoriphagus]|uniref:hypothetical protein n=1 Tax=unclassified Algoriphagus TaxID=2641541 RepID=UPI00257D58C2|nr:MULTISPECIES: hypothetical protein [unclassified Algoriphagus]
MKKVLLFGAFFAFLGLTGFAQEANEEPVTDEEIEKYANVEFLTAQFVNDKTEELKNMISGNEIFQGGARYNEIKAVWGNEEKMAEANVTEDEIAAFQGVLDFMASLQEEAKEYKTNLIMDDEILGVSTYNKVNGAKSDPAIKEKIDSIVESKKAQAAAAKEAESDGM